MPNTPFLTDIDPQMAVKGSRDPLGIQPIWSRLGRHVVGNLTTVTTNVRDFTTVLLGFHFAERLADAGSSEGDLNIFLRWEQLSAHARFRVNGDGRIRGIERVKSMNKDSDRILIRADASGQILSNQRTYGLWGLYTGPSRASGLLEGDPTRLSAAGRELVEGFYLPAFTAAGLRNADQVVQRLSRPKVDLHLAGGDDLRFLRAVAKVLRPEIATPEREAFRAHLLLGVAPGKTQGRQEALATALQETLDEDSWFWTPARVRHLAKRCRSLGPAGMVAATRLERIRVAEQLLAPCAALFGLVLASDGQKLSDVARAVAKQWGTKMGSVDALAVSDLESELRDSTGDLAAGRRWVEVAHSLAGGDYPTALRLLIDQNAFVMQARASAGPWVDRSGDGIRVRYREETPGAFPPKATLPHLWKHSYFLDALREIAMELRA